MKVLFTLFAAGMLAGGAQAQSFCPAAPIPVTITQANGQNLTVIGKGNSLLPYTETVDGYTLINNAGVYEYAVLNDDGTLISSGVAAHEISNRSAKENSLLQNLNKSIRLSETVAQNIIKTNTQANAKSSGVQAVFPGKGKRKLLMLLIDYPDLPRTYTDSNFIALMNEPNYKGTGSFRDYYLANSFNQLDITVDVYGWYRAKNPYQYYGRVNGDGRTRELGAEAIDAAEAAGIDFSPYDNDGDGRVEAIMFVHSGPGAEVGSQTKYIWSHRASLGSFARKYDGVNISDYIVQPEKYNGGQSGIGVYAHEFGHSLGLPDLYDVDYTSEGVGEWAIMGGGPYLGNTNTPASHDAWSKIDMGWVLPTTLTDDSLKANKIYFLNPANSNSEIYKIRTHVKGEHLLLENRQSKGYDRYLPGHGLLVWHVDSALASRFRSFGDNSINATDLHKGVELLQADGLNQMNKPNNRGDSGDPFPGKTRNTSISDFTKPTSNMYSGRQSAVAILNITEHVDGRVSFGTSKADCYLDLTLPTALNFCDGDAQSVTVSTTLAVQWYRNGLTITGATTKTLDLNQSGTYSVIATNSAGCVATSSPLNITVSATPAKPNVYINGNTLSTDATKGIQWYFNGKAIPGEISPSLLMDQSGYYSVKITASGCSNASENTYYALTGIGSNIKSKVLSIYPNPAHGQLNIDLPVGNDQVVISDLSGKILIEEYISSTHQVLNLNLKPGMYILKTQNNQHVQKLIVY